MKMAMAEEKVLKYYIDIYVFLYKLYGDTRNNFGSEEL